MTATVVAVWLILAAGYGIFFSFSIFMVPLLEEFRWSRALTAGALSVSTLLQGLLAPLVGIAVDRLGPRPVILAGVFSLSTASVLAATIRTPWELYLYTGVIAGIGMVALGWVPMGVLLSRWVVERRGWVVGVAFSGMGMGVFVLGPLAQALIDAVGWRGATAILGVSIMMLVFPVAWWGCRDPKKPLPKIAHDAASSGTLAGPRWRMP